MILQFKLYYLSSSFYLDSKVKYQRNYKKPHTKFELFKDYDFGLRLYLDLIISKKINSS